jgi:hypothetical protein
VLFEPTDEFAQILTIGIGPVICKIYLFFRILDNIDEGQSVIHSLTIVKLTIEALVLLGLIKFYVLCYVGVYKPFTIVIIVFDFYARKHALLEKRFVTN